MCLINKKNKKQQAFTVTTVIMQEKKYATLVRLCSQLKSNKISTNSVSTIYTNFYKQSTKVILKIKVWRCKKVPRRWSLGEVAFLEMEEKKCNFAEDWLSWLHFKPFLVSMAIKQTLPADLLNAKTFKCKKV